MFVYFPFIILVNEVIGISGPLPGLPHFPSISQGVASKPFYVQIFLEGKKISFHTIEVENAKDRQTKVSCDYMYVQYTAVDIVWVCLPSLQAYKLILTLDM